ncbi:flagellar hook-length control protein FliK [Vibrio ichthyoenteri ATCC 700023]|uniref:Flagellar hook-length control protein FliK n=1 Tax=Vibrio ichthyoenteri ATCC 700023 TaxID=870968 RepID=F9RXD0_9VIBR|nr:flagellar hook-length control protein FliK [Vibrio ichthyoenteri]EGU48253.1 flagellar hook-length control protein FliK [Vibrio ichthyoenteri ATCC 700023]
MNVNLSSSTDVAKVSNGAVDGKSTTTESAEDEGFFAKLTAFIKGESKADAAQGEAEAKVNAEVAGDAVIETASAATEQGDEVTALDDASSEQALLDGDTLDTAEQQKVQTSAADDSEHKATSIPPQLEKFIEKPSPDSAQVEQALAENQQFLGRLDQSVKSLQTKDGKALPPHDAAVLDGDVELIDGQATLTEAQALIAGQSANVSEDDLAKIDSQNLSEQQKAELAALMGQSASKDQDQDQATVDSAGTSVTAQDTEGKEKVEGAAIAWNSQASSQTSSGDTAKLGKEEVVLKGNAQSAAIMQQAQNQAQHSAQTTAQASAAQTSHAAAASNGAINAAVLTPTAPMDASAAQQLQTVTAPVNSAAQAEQIMQAAMGLKGTAVAGKLASSADGQAPAGIEAALAQQLGQTAGAQGVNNQIRPEQVAQQPPMPLNREMASEQVAERVQMMLSKNLKNIDIRLDPPELGRMQIRMNMNGDGTNVHFTVANSQARDIVEQAMPRLREMLAQQGLQLGDTSVQQQASGQQQNGYAAANEGGFGQGSSDQHASSEENLEPDVKLDLNVATKRDGISYYA